MPPALRLQIDFLAPLYAVGQLRDNQRELLVVLNRLLVGGRRCSHKLDRTYSSAFSSTTLSGFTINSFSRRIALRYRMLAAGSVRPRAWAISWFESCS